MVLRSILKIGLLSGMFLLGGCLGDEDGGVLTSGGNMSGNLVQLQFSALPTVASINGDGPSKGAHATDMSSPLAKKPTDGGLSYDQAPLPWMCVEYLVLMVDGEVVLIDPFENTVELSQKGTTPFAEVDPEQILAASQISLNLKAGHCDSVYSFDLGTYTDGKTCEVDVRVTEFDYSVDKKSMQVTVDSVSVLSKAVIACDMAE